MLAKELATTNFISINKNEFVSKLIGKLKDSKQKSAIVTDNKGKYVGITQKRKMYKINTDLNRLKIDKVTEKIPSLKEDDKIEEIARLMYVSDSRLLPIIKGGKVISVVKAMDLIKKIKQIPQIRELSALEIATINPVTMNEFDSLGKALSIMRDYSVNRLPIINEKGKLSGIISFRDVIKKNLMFPAQRKSSSLTYYERDKNSISDLPVTAEMITNVKTLPSKSNALKVIETLYSSKGSQVVLIDNNSPVGIVTPRDILEIYLRQIQEKRNIQFSGLLKVDEVDQKIIEKTVTENYDKLKRMVKEIKYMAIHVKRHSTSKGLRTKYTVNVRLSSPGVLLTAKNWDWKLISTIQGALQILQRQARKHSQMKRAH